MPQVPNAQELALHSLLPTVHSLPPELLQLSASLLAQSKSKAASLKPEEEIGRTYVCCHIACQRLGHKLALEVAKPSPPVKPKVYNKLHTYFNSVLATPKKAERRPEPKTKDVSTPTTKSPASTKTTPLKRQLSVPASTTPTKRTTRALQSSDATQSTENEQEYNPSNSEDLMDVDANVGLGLQDEIDQQLNTETSMYSKTPIRRKEKHAKPPVCSFPVLSF